MAVWMEFAMCRGVNPDIFHPLRGESNAEATKFCDQCAVKAPCLDYALEHRMKGVWGGTSEKERRRMRKAAELNGEAA